MAFSIFNNDDVNTDMVSLLTYIDGLTKAMGLDPVVVDPDIIRSILLGVRSDFPHNDGVDQASAFKKTANIVAFFISEKPIPNPFPIEIIGGELVKIPNHQNSMIGLQLAIDSLDGAEIYTLDGRILTLKNRIALSKHSYIDIIDALNAATHFTHFKMLTVLLEQLAYKTNPNCQYELIEI